MSNKKTLLIISPGFPDKETDSTNLPFLQQFIKTLNAIYTELNIIVIAYQHPYTKSEYKWFGNHIVSLHAKKGILRKPIECIRLWQTLSRLHKENSITGVLSMWLGEYAIVAKWFARWHKVKSICWLQGQDAKKGNVFARLFHARPEEIIALSDSLATEFYINYNVRPAYVIPNGIDPSQFETKEHARNIHILGVGSLIPLKQYHIFIDIVKTLTTKVPGIKAIICGKGPQKEMLTQQILSLTLEENVTLLGEVPHNEVLQIMQRAKIFLHPSSYEGFSTACLEALYAGAHVISFCKPMNKSLKNWHIVATKEEMTEKALELLQDPYSKYEPTALYTINDTAKEAMALFSN